MKAIKVKSSLLSALVGLFLCIPTCKGGALTDITKPYLGEYECKSALYGKMEYLQEFSFITLSLEKDDTFILTYETKNGQKGKQTGNYKYDKEKKSICFSIEGEYGFERCFPMEKGVITLALPLGSTMLYMEFEQK